MTILVIFRKYGLKTHIENFCKIWVWVLTFKILNMGMGNNSNMGGKVRNMGMGIWVYINPLLLTEPNCTL